MTETWVMAMAPDDKESLIEAVSQGRNPFFMFLRHFDPDAQNGIGLITVTNNIDNAKRFDSFEAVLEEWKRQSTVHPIRGDGKPNRPLTVWSIQPRRL